MLKLKSLTKKEALLEAQELTEYFDFVELKGVKLVPSPKYHINKNKPLPKPYYKAVLECGNCGNTTCEALKDDEACCDCQDYDIARGEGCVDCIEERIGQNHPYY